MNSLKILKKMRIFLAWQDEQEEQWLREMAKSGWHLVNYNFAVYTFEKGEPEDIIYKLDYRSDTDLDMDEYVQLYKDLGWEHVTQYTSWHYFRTRATDAVYPEIYTDNEGIINKYKQVRWVMIIVLASQLPLLTTVLSDAGKMSSTGLGVFFQFLWGAIMFVLGYSIYRVSRKIQLLTQS